MYHDRVFCNCGCLTEIDHRGFAPNHHPPNYGRRKRTGITADDYRIVNGPLDTACWIWNREPSAAGYVNVYFGNGPIGVHRLAWELAHGPIPKGLVIDHLCGNRTCVRVEHLRLVRQAENVRSGRGTRLTAEAVAEIRNDTRRYREIAADHGIAERYVGEIKHYRAWR